MLACCSHQAASSGVISGSCSRPRSCTPVEIDADATSSPLAPLSKSTAAFASSTRYASITSREIFLYPDQRILRPGLHRTWQRRLSGFQFGLARISATRADDAAHCVGTSGRSISIPKLGAVTSSLFSTMRKRKCTYCPSQFSDTTCSSPPYDQSVCSS